MTTADHSDRTAATARTGTETRGRTETSQRVEGPRRLLALVRAVSRASTRATALAGRVARVIRPSGWFVGVCAVLGLGVGIAFGWVEWVTGGAIAAVMIVCAVPFLIGSRTYEVTLHMRRDRIVSGENAEGELTVRNPGRRFMLPGTVDVPLGDGLLEVGVPLLRGGGESTHPITAARLARGVYRVGPVTTVRSDPVGLFRRAHVFPDAHDLYVHPTTVVVPSTGTGLIRDLEGSATRRLVDADMAFHAIREYAPGDSRRHIHWKSTAKTGTLMVRQYEESRRARTAVVLATNTVEYADADEFELAVSVASSLGLRAVRESRDTDVVVGVEVPRVVRGRIVGVNRLPTASGRVLLDSFSGVVRSENTVTLARLCRLMVETGADLSLAFVVGGSTLTLDGLRETALAFGQEVAVVAVVCDERAHPRARMVSGMTVLTVGTIDDLAGLLARGVVSP